MDVNKIKHFAELYLKHKQLTAELSVLANEINQMQDGLIEHMATEGINKISLNGGVTVSLKTQVWPKYKNGKSKDDLAVALESDGFGSLVTKGINHQTFAALIREFNTDGKPLPPAISEVVEISETVRLIAKEL